MQEEQGQPQQQEQVEHDDLSAACTRDGRHVASIVNDPDLVTQFARLCLIIALKHGYDHTAQYIFDNYSFNFDDDEFRDRLNLIFRYAAPQGHFAVVKLLLKLDAQHQFSNSNTLIRALLYAIDKDQVAIVRLLLEAGVDVNGEDNENNTPMQWAAAAARPEIIKLLIEQGGKVNRKDNTDIAPLDYSMGRIKSLYSSSHRPRTERHRFLAEFLPAVKILKSHGGTLTYRGKLLRNSYLSEENISEFEEVSVAKGLLEELNWFTQGSGGFFL